MGRFFMYGTITLLAVFVVATYTLLEHGNQGLGRVETYTPDAFPLGPAYDGTEIAVNGTLTYDAPSGEYRLTNAEAQHPPRIEDLSEGDLEPHIGTYVHVNGTYVLEGVDFYIKGKSIRTLEEGEPTASPSTP
jgi:hypothetical protein